MTDADKPRFMAAMVALYKTFNKPADKDITKILFYSIQQLSIEDAEQCITQAILTCEKFPIPADLKRCISLIPRREVMRVEYKPTTDKTIATDSMRIINGIMDGKLDHQKVIACMSEMHRLHPVDGWASEAAQLVQFYRAEEEAHA